MKTNQRGFVNIILIILFVILAVVVGYFVFMKKTTPAVKQTTPVSQNQPATISQLTKEQVLNGFDQCGIQFSNGEISIGYDKYTKLEQACNTAVSSASISSDAMVFADLDNDGSVEALAPVRIVRGSSGGALYVFKNVNGAARVIDSVSIGKENIKIVSVNKDTIVGKTDSFVLPTTQTYKFVNGKLIKQ